MREFRLQRLGEFRAVQRMNGVEQRHRFTHLIGLQGTDQMQVDIGELGFQLRPFRFGFLNPVLSENAVAGLQRRQDCGRGVAFADRDKPCVLGGRDRGGTRSTDTGENGFEVLGGIFDYGGWFGGHRSWHRNWRARS